MAKPLVDALRQSRELVSAANAPGPLERAAVRKLVRSIDEAIARLNGDPNRVDLASVVCHDLKDPLASIVMGAGFLHKTVGAKDDSARRVVNAIVRSAERLGHVISNFHDLAALETGRLTLDPHPWDVTAVLAAELDGLASMAAERGVRLAFETPDRPAMALCDRPRLIQVIHNLVSNAVRFTEAEGSVVIRVEANDPTGRRVRVIVRDTGRGIPPDRLPAVFDHAANAAQISRDGPGLGLPIVKGLVELHGGEVTATSVLGEGSSFEVLLPKAEC